MPTPKTTDLKRRRIKEFENKTKCTIALPLRKGTRERKRKREEDFLYDADRSNKLNDDDQNEKRKPSITYVVEKTPKKSSNCIQNKRRTYSSLPEKKKHLPIYLERARLRDEENLCRAENKLLLEWAYDHLENPYPSGEETAELAHRSNTSYGHVKCWMKYFRQQKLPKIKNKIEEKNMMIRARKQEIEKKERLFKNLAKQENRPNLEWVLGRWHNPYPSANEIRMLKKQGGACQTKRKVQRWFSNFRYRENIGNSREDGSGVDDAPRKKKVNHSEKYDLLVLKQKKKELLRNLRCKENEPLLEWVFDNIDHPYPSADEVAILMKNSGKTKIKVQEWTTKFRRIYLPSFDKKYEGNISELRSVHNGLNYEDWESEDGSPNAANEPINNNTGSENDRENEGESYRTADKEPVVITGGFPRKKVIVYAISFDEQKNDRSSEVTASTDPMSETEIENEYEIESDNKSQELPPPDPVNESESRQSSTTSTKCSSSWLFPTIPSSPIPTHNTRYLIFGKEKIRLSVQTSTIPNAGYGLFLTHLGPSPSWITPSLSDIGIYAPHRPQDIKSRTVMEMKNFLFDEIPAEWSYGGPEKSYQYRTLFDQGIECDVIYDVTSDNTAQLHKEAEATLLPYINESVADKRCNNVYAEHSSDGRLHYVLRGGFKFNQDQEVELFVDYGKAYKSVRQRKQYATVITRSEEGFIDYQCYSCKQDKKGDDRHQLSGYGCIYKSMCAYTVEDVMQVLKYFADSPPEKSDARHRMKWVIILLRKYCTLVLYQRLEGGVPEEMEKSIDEALSLFPRIRNEEDLEAMKMGQYLGSPVMIENNSGYVGGMVERLLSCQSKYLVVMLNGEKKCLNKEEVEDVLYYDRFGLI